jgi:hypothetical protein
LKLIYKRFIKENSKIDNNYISTKKHNGYVVWQNNSKHNRKIEKLKDRYRKTWYGEDPEQKLGTKNLDEHIRLLDKFNPGYVLDYNLNDKEMVIDYKILPGIRMGDINYDDEFKEKIYNYCSSHIVSTWPYAYFEWNPWNILIDGDSIHLIDWDNFQHAKRSLKSMHDLLDYKFLLHF